MTSPDKDKPHERISEKLYAAESSDLIDIEGVSPQEIGEINLLMRALVRLREAEQLVSDASKRYMKLSSQDMRALHYLIVAKRQGHTVTPGMLTSYLKISPASTTKLLNRLERSEHIVRLIHPTDRRALSIDVTPETELAARRTVGKHQARRFYAAARLSSAEREVVTRFLHDMANELDLSNADWTNEQSDQT